MPSIESQYATYAWYDPERRVIKIRVLSKENLQNKSDKRKGVIIEITEECFDWVTEGQPLIIKRIGNNIEPYDPEEELIPTRWNRILKENKE